MLIGYIDTADRNTISGWARDTDAPERRLTLDVYDGDTLITRVVADRLRNDLAASGVGDGRYGFWVPLPVDMLPMACHVISVRFADNGMDLRNSPRPVLPRDGTVDEAFTGWFSRHIKNAANAAKSPEELSPLFSLCTEALSTVLVAQDRLRAQGDSLPVSGLPLPELPGRVQAALSHAIKDLPPLHVPVWPKPRLSIIISASGRLAQTHALIKSIIGSENLRDYEIVLVDATGTTDMVLSPLLIRGGVTFIRLAQAGTTLDAYRRGMTSARGDRLAFLANIDSVEPAALMAMAATLDLETQAMVTPRLMFPDGRIAEVGSRLDALGVRHARGFLEAGQSSRYRQAMESDDVSPRAFMVDRAVLASLGNLDDPKGMQGFLLSDLGLSLKQQGGHVIAQGYAGMTLNKTMPLKEPGKRERATFLRDWAEKLPVSGKFMHSAPLRRALVIDERLPDPTRDAASSAVLSHAQALRRLGWNVEFVPLAADRETVRGEMMLRICGIEPQLGVASAQELLTSRPEQFDLIYLHRHSVAHETLALCRQTQPKARIIYSLADLHFMRLTEEAKITGQAVSNDIDLLRAQEEHCMGAADAVLTHSTSEERWIRQHLPAVPVFRVLWAQPVNRSAPDFAARTGFCFLGGFAHRPNVDAVQHFLTQTWSRIQDGCPGAEFDIAGAGLTSDLFPEIPAGAVLRGYVAESRAYLAGKRVMLAPLRYGAGVKGKVLLAFAEGIPCIMSNVAAEGMGLPSGIAEMLVAQDEESFVRKAIRFYREEPLWRQARTIIQAWALANLSASALDASFHAAVTAPPPISLQSTAP